MIPLYHLSMFYDTMILQVLVLCYTQKPDRPAGKEAYKRIRVCHPARLLLSLSVHVHVHVLHTNRSLVLIELKLVRGTR